MQPLSAQLQRDRARYREQEIPAGYQPRAHLLFTFGIGSLALLAVVAQLDHVQPLEWLTVPLAFLYANLSEYLGHRYPMHHRFRGLGLLYKRHSGQHHRFFTDQAMPYENLRDLRVVLFPPLLVTFFFGTFGVPAWLLLDWLLTANVAWLFIAVGLAYFLNYEFLHLAYHVPPEHPLARVGVIRRLQWLHTRHHDHSVMAHVNFNISYPVCDWLFGTLDRGHAERTGGVPGEQRAA